MSVKITENATIAILEIMEKASLDREKYAFQLTFDDRNNMAVVFVNDLLDCKKYGDLWVNIDYRIEQGDNMVVDFVTDPSKKKGLIFVGEKEYVSQGYGKGSN